MTVIAIFGKEEFLKERAAYEEYNSSLLSVFKVYDYDLFIKELDDILFDDTPKCYIVKNSKNIKEDYRGSVHTFILIMDSKIPVDENIKCDKILNFDKLKTQENNNEVIRWIIKEGESLNIDLSRIAGALFVNSGDNLRKLESEIRKIRTLVVEGTVVTSEEAKSVICFSSSLTPKSIVESISAGKTALALSFYDKLQDQGEETGWILAFLFNFVIQTLRSQYMISKGVKEVASVLSLNGYIFNYSVLPNINKWTSDSLIKALRSFSIIELYHRQGNPMSKMLLEQEIIRLSEEANLKNRQAA